jgi:hypothetical protein
MKIAWRRKRRKRALRHLSKIASVYYNMLPLGGYYQWFHKLNYIRYSINFVVFYVKNPLFSNSYYKITIIVFIVYSSLILYLWRLKITLYKVLDVRLSNDSYYHYVGT